MFRQGLVSLLAREPDLRLVAEVGTAAAALAAIASTAPRVAVVDITPPDMTGPHLIRRIREEHPATAVVALSGHNEPHYVDLALEAGARAYVLKTDGFDELLGAIRTVAATSPRPYLSAGAEAVSEAAREPDRGPRKRALSRREEEVLRMMGSGARNIEIAARLGISNKTIDTYRRRLMKKLGADSSADLVKSAIRMGLASLR